MELSDEDRKLVDTANDSIINNYKKGQHHVACCLRTKDKNYLSLHLDTKGFDVCAEPIALSNALIEGQTRFNSIVAVIMSGQNKTRVIAPCGNCRQILYEYAPDIEVIVPAGNSLKKVTAKLLFPNPYE